MSNPPFAIGQKVVALASTQYGGGIKKGEIVTVAGCFQGSCKCGLWWVAVEERPAQYDTSHCNKCDNIVHHEGLYFFVGKAKYFAPIQTNYSDATSEILEKFKSPNETPDKILIPETA